jgi:hypothetical protein
MIYGVRFKVWVLGLRDQGSGFMIYDLWFGVWGLGFRV